jgi:solute:Na+ symporter, SSS family
MENFATIDYVIFIVYFLLVSGYGYWIYKSKKAKEGEVSDSKDFFLAEGSLTWWAIGASLIASNISAEQFIGMSGNGFTVGVAVAAYEWIAALALIIVAVWFIPVYLKNKIFTMPQFLETRYNQTTSLIMAIFWLFLYVFVNLTSILYLGAIAIAAMTGGEYFHVIVIAMAIFSLLITLGGMKVIGFTDVIQVVVLVIGGLATTYIALTLVSEHFGLGKDAIAGFNKMMDVAPEHFKLMVEKPGSGASQADVNKYLMLPGIAMYFAGIWIVNLNYWGCNQYITQRALGADLKTARTGILFAGFMKLAMPIIVMLPGIAAYVLYSNGHGDFQELMLKDNKLNADNAYSAILNFLPTGLKGLSVAALTAAIVASLAGKANSISTIFTLDIYKRYINKDAGEKKLVIMGRIAILVAIIFSVALTWNDALNIGGEGGFTFIQKYTGFFSPGVFAVFLLGMFWKRTTGAAAVAGVVGGFVLSVFFNSYAVDWFGPETLLWTAYENKDGIMEIPFLICMGWAFVFTLVMMIGMSLTGPKINPKAFGIDSSMFRVAPSTLALIVITLLCLAGLYITFWN